MRSSLIQKGLYGRYALYFAVVLFLFLCVQIVPASAANVVVSPSTGTYSVNQSFTTTIQVDPQGESVNAVEAKLSFDNTKLSVVSVAKTGSVFSLWTTEPTFSNTAGTIDFGGGSPTPFSSRSTLVVVTFRALAEGSGTVRVTSASALAADGLGTDVYESSTDGTFTISAASAPEPTPTPTPTPEPEDEGDTDAAITFGDPPRAPEAGSTTFLDPDVWYDTKVGTFTWTLPFDVDAVRLDIATSLEAVPSTEYDPPIEDFTTTAQILSEGVQYLTLQFKNQVGWGGILRRKIQIDTEAPRPFTINVNPGTSKDAFPLLTFEAKDDTSGIKEYEMTIADNEPFVVTPDEARLGYLLGKLEDGTYTVRVVASDYAGNTTEATVPVLITAGWLPPIEVTVESSFWDLFKGKNLVILILVLMLIAQFVFGWFDRKKREQREQKLRKEAKEIQDQMEKIFSALRDEIYDQINTITKKQRLSKKEREAVENLNQALEVSETLIEKEISDVQSILK